MSPEHERLNTRVTELEAAIRVHREHAMAEYDDDDHDPWDRVLWAQIGHAEALCNAHRAFRNVVDPNDVMTMTCDLEQGHGGTHHDPVTGGRWHRG